MSIPAPSSINASASSKERDTQPHHPIQPFLRTWRALPSTLLVAIIVATLFTAWTPNTLLTSSLLESNGTGIQSNQSPQPVSVTSTSTGKQRVGIVAGHLGNDSGAVCSDGLTEASVNLKIATLVRQDLIGRGYDVDLLEEFDPRLSQYQAAVLVSIHNDSCTYVNDEATGFKVAAAESTTDPEKASYLTTCLVDRYGKDTGLRFDYNSITSDMTQYHAFNEINSSTPAAIIETGFLNLDRQILTQHTDVVAKGVADGILCFLKNETVQPTALATP
jgi:N-acetylmuramoyl-L-alanine amidase